MSVKHKIIKTLYSAFIKISLEYHPQPQASGQEFKDFTLKITHTTHPPLVLSSKNSGRKSPLGQINFI